MVANTKPRFVNGAKMVAKKLETGSFDIPVTLIAAPDPGAGMKLYGVVATSNDTVDINVRLSIRDGISNFVFNTIEVPTLAGFDGIVPPVDLLTNMGPLLPADENGNPFFFLPAGYSLRVEPMTDPTAAKEINVFAIYGELEADTV